MRAHNRPRRHGGVGQYRNHRGSASALHRLLGLAFVAYSAGLVLLSGLVFGAGEAFWPVTLFLFGPRWVIALPLPVLVGLSAVFLDRRLVVALSGVCLVILVPLLGFNVPWARLAAWGERTNAPTIRVLTWNVGGGVEPGPVAWVLDEAQPDIAVLQECSEAHLDQPGDWFRNQAHHSCLLSRFPIVEVAERDPADMWTLSGSGAIVRYGLETPLGRVELTNVHLETPREGLEAVLRSSSRGVPELQAKYTQREIEARVARRWVEEGTEGLRVVAGDFNTPVESNLFRTYWGGFSDCHESAGWGFGHTKRTRRIGARIDHVLAGAGLECIDAQVGPWVGGDHAPLIATLRRSER